MQGECYRKMLIESALDLCTRQGYEATTVDQIAAAAGVTPRDFARYFVTKDAVIMSVIDDLLQATTTALGHVKTTVDPEHALLIATTEVVTAIVNGRGIMTREQMIAMADIVTTTPHLRKQASAVRKQVLTQALAEWTGLDPKNRRVRHAVTMWSAIAAGAYTGRRRMPADYDPQHDDRLPERAITELATTFHEVMGKAPSQQD